MIKQCCQVIDDLKAVVESIGQTDKKSNIVDGQTTKQKKIIQQSKSLDSNLKSKLEIKLDDEDI